MKYDYLIAGAGLFGAVFAGEAALHGKKCLVIDKRNHIIEQIDGMEDVNMYHVLSSRYIGRKTFDEIAIEMNYSRMQINRIHGKALLEFEKLYGNEYLKEK